MFVPSKITIMCKQSTKFSQRTVVTIPMQCHPGRSLPSDVTSMRHKYGECALLSDKKNSILPNRDKERSK